MTSRFIGSKIKEVGKLKNGALITLGAVFVVLTLLFSGCAEQQPSEGAATPSVTNVKFLGGLSGGGGYQYGLALIKVMEKAMPEVTFTLEATQGFVDNAKKIHSGYGDMGVVSSSDALKILKGEAPFDSPGKKVYSVVPLLPPTYFHVLVPADSGINSLSDLHGKRVSVLTRGSLTEKLATNVFEALGIEVQPVYLTHTDAAVALSKGEIDAAATTTFAAQYKDLALSKQLRVLSLTDEEAQKIKEALPYANIKEYDFAQQYEGANVAKVPVVWTLIVAREDLPEDFVYEFVKAVYENKEEIAASYAPAKELDPEMVLEAPVPLHPGVVKYYQEIGISIPENLIPE